MNYEFWKSPCDQEFPGVTGSDFPPETFVLRDDCEIIVYIRYKVP